MLLKNQSELLAAQLVVVSDIHLRSADDERSTLLIDTLSRLTRDVEYVILNGDIFDFCFGKSQYFRRKFAKIGQALTEVAHQGTRVVLVEGNHEFQMSAMGWEKVEIITTKDYSLTLSTGETFLITHGDLIKDDPLYRLFRTLIKSRAAATLAQLLPGPLLDAYALSHAKISRAQDPYRILNHAEIIKSMEAWLDSSDCTHGIMGHFHTPYAEPRQQKPGYLLSVECWDKPNALTFSNGKFGRIMLTGINQPFTAELTQPFLSGRS